MATRFDQSFAIRMIRDFLLALTLIIVAELGGRWALAQYHFSHQDEEATFLAAERLASDIRSIMLNQGGPTAARTVYPIIQRNHNQLGFEIAIEPSPITVESISERFGFEPKGLPPAWSEDGSHHEATVELEADTFCTSCHLGARPGDVLGQVTVRNYRSVRMAEWWREARVVSVVGMANIILHTIALFFLLRLRMEPLLQLRSTIARLAKGQLDLSQRAQAKTNDEFGELARDLNHFLDRVSHVVEDLDGVLSKVAAVNERLTTVSGTMGKQIESVQDKTRAAIKQAMDIRAEAAGPAEDAVQSLDLVLSSLSDMPLPGAFKQRLGDVVQRFRTSATQVRSSLDRVGELEHALVDLAHELRDDSHYLGEIVLLEERMRVVSESGQVLLGRLSA